MAGSIRCTKLAACAKEPGIHSIQFCWPRDGCPIFTRAFLCHLSRGLEPASLLKIQDPRGCVLALGGAWRLILPKPKKTLKRTATDNVKSSGNAILSLDKKEENEPGVEPRRYKTCLKRQKRRELYRITKSLPFPIPLVPPTASQYRSLALILEHEILYTPHIVSRLPHVSQPCPPCSLFASLHYFNTLYVRRVDFVPHLHPDLCQFIAQQYPCLHADPSYVDADSSERVAILKMYQQNVSNLGRIGVTAAEQLGPLAVRVEKGDLRVVQSGDWIFATRGKRRWWRVRLYLIDD